MEEFSKNQSVESFFVDKTIFITGGTGFLGKVLIEKLLRSCGDLKKIYVLARAKKGKSCDERLEELFGNVLYDRLKLERGDALKKVCIVAGDCELENLGLKDKNYALLVNEIEVVFHVAATVRFDEKLQRAAYINVRATRDLLAMGRRMSKLKSFVHVSTAYSFCPQPVVDEKFYKVPICASELLMVVDNVSEDHLDKITPIICKPWPNTYAFTKAIAEDAIRNEARDLPVVIVRPSVVIATMNEPVDGWIDNIYGPTGIFLGISLGVIRTCVYQENGVVDQVPADLVVNNLISAAWSVGVHKSSHNSNPIFNCVSSVDNQITWGKSQSLSQRYAAEYPSAQMKWHLFFKHTSDLFTFTILHFLLHLLPAYIGDLFLGLLGKKPMLVKMYNKIGKTVTLVSYFTLRQWIFKNNNNKCLLDSLNGEDRKNFGFDVKDIDWNLYARSYVKGARKYLLKEELESLPQARKKAFRLKIAHYFLVAVLLYFLVRLFLGVFRF